VSDKDGQDEIALMGNLQRCAGEILALSPVEREARFDHYHKVHMESALGEMKSQAAAEEHAGRMDKALRWIVRMMDSMLSRGAAGERVSGSYR